MESGPSKEDLELYWKSSRQYFDELANYYRTADPEYYNKFIAPFYSNTLYTASQGKSSATVKVIFILVFIFFAAIAAGITAYLFSVKQDVRNERVIEKPDKNGTKTPENIQKVEFPDDEFLLGAKYLAEKDYDKAEEHFKKVKPGDKNYQEAQQMLESIKYLRKYNK
jgi:tetratricopeptide (TPR) repeat protein